MANTLRIPKAHLTMALCLPLAVVVGYFLVDPMEPSSLAFVGFVLAVLTLPLLIKWHHPLLVFCWNAAIAPVFLPGQPYLWTWLAGIGFLFGILNRSVDANHRFIQVPSIRNSLLFLAVVVTVTAYFNGGLGFAMFGSSRYGGRRYFNVAAAIIGYFALTSQRIPTHRGRFYAGMFFLSMATGIIPNIAFFVGEKMSFVYYIFTEVSGELQSATASGKGMGRIFGLTLLANGLFCYLLARFGIRGLFDSRKWWRILFFVAAVSACLLSGFRSLLILLAMVFAIQFYLEGLHRTRLLWVLLALGLITGGLALTESQKLPFFVQRTLSFLPIEVNSDVKNSANSSLEWRLNMWRVLLPEVPKYLLKGKGFGIDPSAMYFSTDPARQREGGFEWAIVAGDYHSGPLSLIIPLGIWGLIGFVWFILASLRYLYKQFREGDPVLKQVNTLLLSYFLARLILYIIFFGGFHSDFFHFTGVIALSVSLNGTAPAPQPESELTLSEVEDPERRALRDDYA